jgi:uncharacterized protein (DUF1697 family)
LATLGEGRPRATMVPMTDRRVALLRGVNVGGNKRVAMADLRSLLTGLGYDDVRTHLQSGNAVFSSSSSAGRLAAQIERALAAELRLQCRVIVRTSPEMQAVMAADPLLDRLGNPSRHLVGFLSDTPTSQAVTHLTDQDYGAAALRIVESHLYLWCPDGITRSPFARMDFDKTLGAAVTLRNWKTVTKLAEMAEVGS